MPDTVSASPTRRSFLSIATISVGLVGVGAAAFGILSSLSPSADVIARTKGFKIRLSDIPEGSQLTMKIFGYPVFIRHRTAKEIAAAEAVDLAKLPFNQTFDVRGRPLGTADDRIRRASADGRFIALVGVGGWGCALLGDGAGDFAGWFDACRGTHYDTSGRFRKGYADGNLRLPRYELVDGDTLWFTDPDVNPQRMVDELLYR